VFTDFPVYDVDAMLAVSPTWKVLYDIFVLCDGYNEQKHPQLHHHERVLCDAHQCASEACNGLDYALEQGVIAQIFIRKDSLLEINAVGACSVLDELRSYHQSLGAITELECGEVDFNFDGDEEENQEKWEKMIEFAQSLSGAFLDSINQSLESWFLQNLDHFRIRKPD